MNDDIKLGYNIACNGLNEDIDTMIEELHNAYMRQTDEKVKDRLDAQIKILWSFKSRIEDCIAEGIEGMNNILSKQQLELVLKRNTINDLNNKLTEKQSENEKLQSLCTSKDVIIKEQQAENEQLQRNLKQCENGYCAKCTLSHKKAVDCLTGIKSRYIQNPSVKGGANV